MFIHKVCQALKKANIPYAIVGGYAVALHGAVRGTVDIDLANASYDRIQTANGDIRILSKKDLIAMKQESGRPQDIEDIKSLRQL